MVQPTPNTEPAPPEPADEIVDESVDETIAETARAPVVVEQLSAAEREYRAALKAAESLGLTGDHGGDGSTEQVAIGLAARLGLDTATPTETPSVGIFADLPEEPEAATEAEDEDDILGPEATDGRAWYVLNTYSGHENRVQKYLERRIASMDVKDRIFDIVVPTEEELEIRGGQRKHVQRKLLPGYVLVHMLLDEDTWYVVRNTPGVTGFVGGEHPQPLPRSEVKTILSQMRVEEPRVRVGFEVGDAIRVMEGPFQDFIGQVDEINMDKGKVRVLISMFGRETPVELDFVQVEKN